MINIKEIVTTLDKDIQLLELHTLADLHLGDKHCDTKSIQKRIKYIAGQPNAYALLNGDLMNNATKTSVSDCYSEQASPMEQIRTTVELMEPIKDKIIAVTSGNHEKRTYKKEGIDLMEIAAQELGLIDRFWPGAVLIFLRFGKLNGKYHSRRACYTIYALHGSGGGRKEGAKAIRLADMASIVDVDIYIHSHTHMPMVIKQAFYRTDTQNNKAALVDKLFVNTAASLHYGGYGEEYEFKPSSKANPVIYLNGRKKHAEVTL